MYSDGIIANDKFDRYFNSLLLQYALKLRVMFSIEPIVYKNLPVEYPNR